MIKYTKSSVFNVDVEVDAIVNTVNCLGVMGAGIALEFKLRYPLMYNDYVLKCNEKMINVGKVDYYKGDYSEIIINFPTKWHFKYPSKMKWVEDGLKDFIKTYKKYDVKSVAFPKLGTNNGGLEWNSVKLLMERYLSDLEIDIYICLDDLDIPEGVEKQMLELFNSVKISDLEKTIKLNKTQKENLEYKRPYIRFWMISETDKIGMKTYSQIFTHFYECAMNGKSNIVGNIEETIEQLTIFDI